MDINYTKASTEDCKLILELQKQNLPKSISSAEYKKEGFVTLEHELDMLIAMNSPHPHTVAKHGQILAGYALITTPSKAAEIPLLLDTLQAISNLNYNDVSLKDSSYFIMGQVCVAKSFRKKGVFRGLYRHLAESTKNDFDFIITEVAVHNVRSMEAHIAVGFEVIQIHEEDGVQWAIILLDIR